MKTIKSFILLYLHSLVLASVSVLLIGYPFLIDEEASLNKWTIVFLDGLKEKGDSKQLGQFYFIDTHGALELARTASDPKYPEGTVPVADRKKLARVFDILDNLPYAQSVRAILCDIQLLDTTANDCQLEGSIHPLKQKAFFPKAYDQERKKTKELIFDLPNTGLIDYQASEGKFLKYDFQGQDQSMTLPLLLFQKMSGKTIELGRFFLWVDGRPCFKSFVPRLYVQNRFIDGDANYQQNIADLVTSGDSDQRKFAALNLGNFYKSGTFNHKIIVIGDANLNGENFKTATGALSGPVILTNAYLCLAGGDNRFYYSMVPVLAILFLFPSWLLFNRKTEEKKRSLFALIVSSKIKYPFVIAAISCLSYLFYGTHIGIALITTYFAVVDFFLNKLEESTWNEKFQFFKENIKTLLKIPIR